jgi:glycosyltransferase involved in cell wall biosynthesis
VRSSAGEDSAWLELSERPSVSFGIPSFGEGESILVTLDSLDRAAAACGIHGYELILSDSSPTTETVEVARRWAAGRVVQLVVDRSEARRISKVARNVIHERARAAIMIQLAADVRIEPAGLQALLSDLVREPRPEVAIGIAAPEPAARGLDRRASAWQLRAAARASAWQPPDRPRAQTALWGAWRSFYSTYRFALGTGTGGDDVELQHHLVACGVATRSSRRAIAYKMPARGLLDFHLQTARGHASANRQPRSAPQLVSAIVEGARDPLGLGLYAYARLWSALRRRVEPKLDVERWLPSASTKERPAP